MLSKVTATKLVDELKRSQLRSEDQDEGADRSIDYSRIVILPSSHFNAEEIGVAKGINEMLEMRQAYVFKPLPPDWKPTATELDQVSYNCRVECAWCC